MRNIDLTGTRPRPAYGFLASVAAVAFTTALIYPLREVVPAVSTGVTYLLAVLVISTFWGLRLGLLTAFLSALCFNFFHIPPTGRLSIAEGENWVALVVFFVAAAVASTLAELARSRAEDAELRRREADLSAELAHLLLAGIGPERALGPVSERLASALELDWTRVSFDRAEPGTGGIVIPLDVTGEPAAAIEVPASVGAETLRRLRERIAPTLSTLLTAAVERRRLSSEAIEAQALRRSDELKTALLRSISHDLRTPLTSIVAAGEALGSGTLSIDERTELAEVVRGESARLTRLVEQLLDLSRLESGAASPRREWTSIEEVVTAAVEQHGAELIDYGFEGRLPLVNVDGAQLERAVANVIENAVRHGAGTNVSVGARTVGSRLVLRVVDRGPGVEPADLVRIFEPFYRSGGRPADGSGSGLGLAIAQGFVSANGGTIRAESLPGQGTAIVIELPVEDRSVGEAVVP